jgi:lipopolysaccharide export system protein LptC
MSKWHSLSIIVLIGILGIVLWQSPPAILKDLADTTTPIQQYPDAFLIKSKTAQYNAQGQLSHTVISERSNYYEPKENRLKNYTLLTEPKFAFYSETNAKDPKAEVTSAEKTTNVKAPDNANNNNIAWNASSKIAKSINNDEEVLLSGDVLLIQQPHAANGIATTITSEEFLIKPNLQYAETDKPVMIKDASSVTTSTGLTLSLDTNTVELLSNVRSRYEPR